MPFGLKSYKFPIMFPSSIWGCNPQSVPLPLGYKYLGKGESVIHCNLPAPSNSFHLGFVSLGIARPGAMTASCNSANAKLDRWPAPEHRNSTVLTSVSTNPDSTLRCHFPWRKNCANPQEIKQSSTCSSAWAKSSILLLISWSLWSTHAVQENASRTHHANDVSHDEKIRDDNFLPSVPTPHSCWRPAEKQACQDKQCVNAFGWCLSPVWRVQCMWQPGHEFMCPFRSFKLCYTVRVSKALRSGTHSWIRSFGSVTTSHITISVHAIAIHIHRNAEPAHFHAD